MGTSTPDMAASGIGASPMVGTIQSEAVKPYDNSPNNATLATMLAFASSALGGNDQALQFALETVNPKQNLGISPSMDTSLATLEIPSRIPSRGTGRGEGIS